MHYLISEKMKLQCDIAEIDDLMTVVKAKRSDLRDTQSRLRDQIKLCHDEISLGSRWGDKKPTITLTPQTGNQPNDKSDLDEILEHLEEDFNLGVKKDWEEEPKKEVSTEKAQPTISNAEQVEDFLSKGLDKVVITNEVSFEEIFEEMQ